MVTTDPYPQSHRRCVHRRLNVITATFAVLSLAVLVRLAALEVRDGDEYRAVAAEPVVRTVITPARRGAIVDRHGTVLAYDRPFTALAVHYRWLQEPADARWLRRTARSRLSAAERRVTANIVRKEQEILAQRAELAQRLAALCGLGDEEWAARTARVQAEVQRIAARVNERHQQRAVQASAVQNDSATAADDSLPQLVLRSIGEAISINDESSPPVIAVAEEQTEHILFEGLSLEAAAEIESQPQQYPGVKLVQSHRRVYPAGATAGHTIGYLGALSAEELAALDPENKLSEAHRIGRAGLEKQYEMRLAGQPGIARQWLEVRGEVVHEEIVQPQRAGETLQLTLDLSLSRACEQLLDDALARRLPSGDLQTLASSGGAVVVLDVASGAVLAAASAPRFDPNAFDIANDPRVTSWLHAAARPLFDRSVQMAIPPGSTMKVISAAAILAGGTSPHAPVECQGYLRDPAALRCALFLRQGIGHGPVAIGDALARSCNVYFFHHAEHLGSGPLVDWAHRFGLGKTTGIDLPTEARGTLMAIADNDTNPSSTDRATARLTAIGQGPVTATPLQMARVAAAVANGGKLVWPRFAMATAADTTDTYSPGNSPAWKTLPHPSPKNIDGLSPEILATLRKGLRETVADEEGTAHATLAGATIAVAGKTGTAQTGKGRPDHAWFIGYAPAENPRVAFCIALEHAGDGGLAAGSVAKLLVERIEACGLLK